jgi:hypothetical protein
MGKNTSIPGMERDSDVMPSHRVLSSMLTKVWVTLSGGTERRTPSLEITEVGGFVKKISASSGIESIFMMPGSDKLIRREIGSSGGGMLL